MKTKVGLPPNIDKIRKRFGDLPIGVVFTYGDTLYIQTRGRVPDDLKVHEKVHTAQQGDDPEEWWNKYLANDKYRLEQEVEAYKKQYNFFRSTCKIKSRIPEFLDRIAGDLSSKLYGKIVSFEEAKKLIEGGSFSGRTQS